jgi:DNA phosphorothioation-dependent restriction protein DptG
MKLEKEMLKRFSIVLLSFCFSFAFGEENSTGKEIALIDGLIESAQNNLNNLTSLKETIEKYQTVQNRYMQDPNDTETLYKMIRLAHEILENIKTSQMTSLFEPSFLSELSIISKPAAKLGIPKP